MKELQITNVEYVKEYILKLNFNDGKVVEVNFLPFLVKAKHPSISKYLNKDKFSEYRIVDGNLDWNDFELCFPIWDLYNDSLTKNKRSDGQEAS